MTPAPAIVHSEREQWLRRRRELVTASDVAAILGEDERRGPLSVYCEKVGDTEPEDNEAMVRGRDFEEAIARAKAVDPSALQLRVRELERQLVAQRPAPAPAPKPVEIIKPAVAVRLEALAKRYEQLTDKIRAELAAVSGALGHTYRETHARTMPLRHEAREGAEAYANLARHSARRAAANNNGSGEITATQAKILDCASHLAGRGIHANVKSVARWLGIHPHGGRYNTNLAWLRTMGVITPSRPIRLTEGARR